MQNQQGINMANYSEKEAAVQRFTYDGTVTKFYFQFPFSDAEDLVVFYGEEEKSLNIDYTSTPALQDGIATNEGYIELVTFPDDNSELVIVRQTALDRETDFATDSRFTAALVDAEFDQALRQVSDNRLSGNSIKAPLYKTGEFSGEIKEFGASKILSIDEDGSGVKALTVSEIPELAELVEATEQTQEYAAEAKESAESAAESALQSVSDLKAAAISLGTSIDNIIYSTDTTSAIPANIFVADTGVTYSVPEDAQGELIVSIVDNVLTTASGDYDLIEVKFNQVFSTVADMVSAGIAMNSTAKTGGTTWKRTSTESNSLDDYESVGSIFANDFGITVVSDESLVIVDDQALLQQALDKAQGNTLYYSGFIGIADTIYIPFGTNVIQLGNLDSWRERVTGGGIVAIGSGTARIWTDIGEVTRPFDSTWYDLEDSPITVAVVQEGDTKLQNVYVTTNSTTPWDVGIFNPACKRAKHESVYTGGYFTMTGYYIDATWSDRNTALMNLHENTYGRAVNTDQAPNELSHKDCWYFGGVTGVIEKGNNRNPELADSTSDLVWSWGGASDIYWSGCRFGNSVETENKLASGFYCDWGYARSVTNKNDKYFQNQYFYGCSSRPTGGRYAMCFDRCNFVHLDVYSEMHGSYESEEVTASATSGAELIVSPNIGAGSDGRSYIIRLIGDEWNIRESDFALGCTITSSSGGSFRLRGIGYDDTGRYMITRESDLSGGVLSGDTLTQASAQTGRAVIASMDRTQNMISIGQSNPTTASKEVNASGGRGGNFSELRAAGVVVTAEEITAHVDGSISLFSHSGNINMESDSATTLKGVVSTNLSTEGSQINLYANSESSNDRIRWSGGALSSYNQANLGEAARRFSTGYFVNSPDVSSDATLKDQRGELSTSELSAAKRIAQLPRVFQWIKEQEEKKDTDKTVYLHCSPMVQDIIAVFEDEDLDYTTYGFINDGGEDGTMSIQPQELLWMICAAQQSQLDEFEVRLSALES
ncbi:MAG: hypothetical protein WBG43_13030 [Marinifilaceae bacterium]